MESPETESTKKLKIGIIGAGLSGCSSAYFLKHIFDDKVEIVIFEKSSDIGGRLSTFEFNNRHYETGGSILHPSNLYMKQFLEICGLEKRDKAEDKSEYFGIYNSDRIVFEKTGKYFGLLDKINFFRQYGFFQLLKFKKWVDLFIKDFSKIYKLQDHGFTFIDLEHFLNKLNPKLYKLSQSSIKQALENENFNNRIITELASIACLTNYGQTTEIDGLVGAVSLAGSSDGLWAVKHGNKSVPIKLAEKSGARVLLSTEVKLIAKDPDHPEEKNLIVYKTQNGEEITDNSFDYVIIGFPIYNKTLGKNFQIDFENMDQFSSLEMQLTNTYFISGEIKLFNGLPTDKRVELLGMDPEVAFRSVSVQLPTDYSKEKDKELYLNKTGPKLYKIFAEQDLNEDSFSKIFKNDYKVLKRIPWLAYPKYNLKPSSKSIPSVILDSSERSRVFYLNSLEWSSSCMEICAISARNVANLITSKEKARVKRFFQPSSDGAQFLERLHTVCKISTLILITGFIIGSCYKYAKIV